MFGLILISPFLFLSEVNHSSDVANTSSLPLIDDSFVQGETHEHQKEVSSTEAVTQTVESSFGKAKVST